MLKRIKVSFLERYKARKQKNRDLTKDHALHTARVMLERAKYCFLITQSTESWCSARLLEPIVDAEDFILWFGTHPSSRKVKEIKTNPHVTVALENVSENANLVLYGVAVIEDNAEIKQQQWKETWRMFFPNGPLGQDYVVIKVEVKRMELMNFSRNVIPEPFGLKPLVFTKQETTWGIETTERQVERKPSP
jgi:general stress protein 26